MNPLVKEIKTTVHQPEMNEIYKYCRDGSNFVL